MSVYRAGIVTHALYIEASSETEAEAKYSAFFDGIDCPEHEVEFDECECVEHHDDEVDHDMRIWR